MDATDEALAILGLCCKWAMGVEGESSVEDLRKQVAGFGLFELRTAHRVHKNKMLLIKQAILFHPGGVSDLSP